MGAISRNECGYSRCTFRVWEGGLCFKHWTAKQGRSTRKGRPPHTQIVCDCEESQPEGPFDVCRKCKRPNEELIRARVTPEQVQQAKEAMKRGKEGRSS